MFPSLQLNLRASPTLLHTLFPWWKNIDKKLPFILPFPHVMQEAMLMSGLENQKTAMPSQPAAQTCCWHRLKSSSVAQWWWWDL